MADLGSSGTLPEGSSSYSFATNASQPESREKHKNYVFVDEHNRHRRLKVMRACAACRRRKIKCDAATTNTWPCAPCVKQQLECVPPSSDKDGQDDTPDDPRTTNFHSYPPNTPSTHLDSGITYPQQVTVPTSYSYNSNLSSSTSTFFDGTAAGSSVPPQSVHHGTLTPVTPHGYPQHAYQSSPYQPSPSAVSTSGTSHQSDAPDADLADVLRELKIDQGGVAPYIANQHNLGEIFALEEQEPPLPPLQHSPNSTAEIPVEMMPSDQIASRYFEYFFNNIHPYVPVIHRASFYHEWQADRYSLPPLITEGILACSAHLLGHNDVRARWLALAARHEDNFRDMPRLSTIQGLILVMKARESAPKRGYYYRSWMTIQYMIQMGKDLGLHTHNKLHVQGKPCDCTPIDCILKTRIWHTLFQMEVMVGGPQGRYDFTVDLDSANLQVPQSIPGVDFSELKISQDHAYFVRLVHNVRITAGLYTRIKQSNSDCSSSDEFTRHNDRYLQLGKEFPQHLQIRYPEDGSAPSLPFHFVGNLQSYHLLSFVMHLRPQLEMNSRYDEQSWKDVMSMCHNEATKICRLHEAILHHFGLSGLLCMLRGINTAIYTILSCTLLHLVAITSPDPSLNERARDYFPRHMRILEKCSSAWPVPQLQVQIESLRQAFSADLSRPFELRQSFPFGSPPPRSGQPTPSSDSSFLGQSQSSEPRVPHHFTGSFDTNSVTPPQTTLATSQDLMSPVSFAGVETAYLPGQQAQWDPSGVFDKWHTAFNPSLLLESRSPGTQASSMNPSTLAPTSAPVYHPHPQQHQQLQQQQQHPQSYFNAQQQMAAVSQSNTSPTYIPHMMPQPQGGFLAQGPAISPSSYGQVAQPYVTPSMWQDAVAQSSGWKRRHEGDSSEMSYKRMR